MLIHDKSKETNKFQTFSVLLVDDDPCFRGGIRTLLDFYTVGDHKLSVIGEANRPSLAFSIAQECQPDFVLIDMELIEGDGLMLLQQLQESDLDCKMLVLSGHQEDAWIYQAMQSGAHGYVFKDKVSQQLFDAIASVLTGQVYLPPEVAAGFFRSFQKTQASLPTQIGQPCDLSEREQEVLYWLVQGASNEKIAKTLFISVATVKAHLTNIFLKMQVESRTQAIVAAIKLNLVQA